MSNILLFSIKDNIDYFKMVKISNSLVKLCINHKKGVIFNFLGYDNDLINRINDNYYFSISDDFLQLNSEFLTVEDILFLDTNKGKEEFTKKFSILDEVCLLLKKNNINKYDLIISDQDANFSDYIIISKIKSLPTKFLYEYILTKKENAYSFDSVIFKLENY